MVEIAYRFPGLSWKRKTFSSTAAFERWLDKQDSDIEVQFREV